jgi:putative DNA primase/helicase
MSRRPPFEPVGFAEKLEYSGDYVSDNNLIYQWTGTHWTAVDDSQIERMALKWIAKGKHGTVNAANARAAHQTAVRWLPVIAEPEEVAVLPVQNGYLHIGNGGVELKPHDKELGLRHVLSCDYAPSAPRPTEFIKFLTSIIPDEHVLNRVQEYIGYTLLPDARYQRAQIWLGSGANGKGALANIVQALHMRTAAVQLDALDGFKTANLIGASLIYCDEAPQRNINEQAMKSLIAGELVQIDRKYRDPIDVRVNGKWIILANHIPAVTDQSSGFWRRFDIVPFSVTIPEAEREPMLAKRIITQELSGVLNWALDGLLRLLARGRFDEVQPQSMRAAVTAAKTETNSVQAWSSDQGITLTTTIDTSKTDVYSAYAGWCKSNGMAAVSSPKFWKRLSDALGGIAEGRTVTESGRIRVCNINL